MFKVVIKKNVNSEKRNVSNLSKRVFLSRKINDDYVEDNKDNIMTQSSNYNIITDNNNTNKMQNIINPGIMENDISYKPIKKIDNCKIKKARIYNY